MLRQNMRKVGIGHQEFPRIYNPASAEFIGQLAFRNYITELFHTVVLIIEDLIQNCTLQPSEFLHASLI